MKNVFLVFLLFVSFILTSCVSDNPDSFFRTPDAIKYKLKSLEGNNIDSAISMMGLPKAEQMIAGRKIYVWSDSGSVTTLNSQPLIDSSGNFNTWVFANKKDFQCVVRAVVNENEIITLIEIKANSVYYCPGQ